LFVYLFTNELNMNLDFGRYTSQNEHSMDDSNEVNDDLSTIPPLMSLNILQPQPLMSTKSLPVPKEK